MCMTTGHGHIEDERIDCMHYTVRYKVSYGTIYRKIGYDGVGVSWALGQKAKREVSPQREMMGAC